ncbi:rnf149 [Symbiodinium necroappetens]|uniref:Rnf149 protein n=1 Tax=Symbiodinium necroappetens TaxID=1628268 RepID=A0A812WF24_9DINO|nr:rnf149 [Symbiodinium necroappetens]
MAASELERNLATCILCCLTSGWAVMCLVIVAMNLAIPGLPFMQELLVTMLSLTCFLCLSCRLMVVSDGEADRSYGPGFGCLGPGPPYNQIWSSMRFPALDDAQPVFHLFQLKTPSNSSSPPVKAVLKRVYIPEKPHITPQKTCACCLDDFANSDLVALLPCGHVFHEVCIMRWFVTQASAGVCPMCRSCSTRGPVSGP